MLRKLIVAIYSRKTNSKDACQQICAGPESLRISRQRRMLRTSTLIKNIEKRSLGFNILQIYPVKPIAKIRGNRFAQNSKVRTCNAREKCFVPTIHSENRTAAANESTNQSTNRKQPRRIATVRKCTLPVDLLLVSRKTA